MATYAVTFEYDQTWDNSPSHFLIADSQVAGKDLLVKAEHSGRIPKCTDWDFFEVDSRNLHSKAGIYPIIQFPDKSRKHIWEEILNRFDFDMMPYEDPENRNTSSAIDTRPSTLGSTQKDETSAMKSFPMNTMFRQVSNVVLDAVTGKISIKTDNGLVSIEFKDDDAHVLTNNPMDSMGFEIPAYAIATPIDKVERGDIYVSPEGKSYFVLGVDGDKLKTVGPNGTNHKISPVINLMFGSQTALIVKNYMNGFAGSGINPVMLMLAQQDDDKSMSQMSKMMLLSSMMQGNSMNMGGFNPMMFAMMMK